MTDTLLDLSQNNDLRFLAALLQVVNRAADNIPFLLAGAMARDLLLQYAHKIEIGRATKDVDLAFQVPDWEQFHLLRQRLLELGLREIPRKGIHKLAYGESLEVDILPFGSIEKPDRTILIPPENAFSMSMFGLREALKSSVEVKLPGGVRTEVASLPALTILKLMAWKERHIREPGKDAYDLQLLFRTYSDIAGNRLFESESNPYLGSPGDYECAGIWLLGQDIALLLEQADLDRLLSIVIAESDENGQLQLAGEMMRDKPERAIEYLAALTNGLTTNKTST